MQLAARSSTGCIAARRSARPRARRATVVRAEVTYAPVNVEQLKAARIDVEELLKCKSCSPIIVRLAWHDSGTYDATKEDSWGWPRAGGATGAIRMKPEINHGANAGLAGAIALLEPLKQKYPDVSWADLFQMASATAVEISGGPKIKMQYGRADAASPEDCPPEGNLPAAGHPFHDGAKSPAEHLRNIFGRMGFNDQEIVVLSGGHTLGRSRPERSGWGKESTKYTKDGPGAPGGQSWTADWLVFNNSYFKEIKEQRDAELLVLPTDAAVFEDEGFRPFAEKYAADEGAFFADYAAAHKKLSELGVKWVPGAPVSIE